MEPDRDARLGVLMVASGNPANSDWRFPPPRVAGGGTFCQTFVVAIRDGAR